MEEEKKRRSDHNDCAWDMTPEDDEMTMLGAHQKQSVPEPVQLLEPRARKCLRVVKCARCGVVPVSLASVALAPRNL